MCIYGAGWPVLVLRTKMRKVIESLAVDYENVSFKSHYRPEAVCYPIHVNFFTRFRLTRVRDCVCVVRDVEKTARRHVRVCNARQLVEEHNHTLLVFENKRIDDFHVAFLKRRQFTLD